MLLTLFGLLSWWQYRAFGGFLIEFIVLVSEFERVNIVPWFIYQDCPSIHPPVHPQILREILLYACEHWVVLWRWWDVSVCSKSLKVIMVPNPWKMHRFSVRFSVFRLKLSHLLWYLELIFKLPWLSVRKCMQIVWKNSKYFLKFSFHSYNLGYLVDNWSVHLICKP